jgi:hypothetical protein
MPVLLYLNSPKFSVMPDLIRNPEKLLLEFPLDSAEKLHFVPGLHRNIHHKKSQLKLISGAYENLRLSSFV